MKNKLINYFHLKSHNHFKKSLECHKIDMNLHVYSYFEDINDPIKDKALPLLLPQWYQFKAKGKKEMKLLPLL